MTTTVAERPLPLRPLVPEEREPVPTEAFLRWERAAAAVREAAIAIEDASEGECWRVEVLESQRVANVVGNAVLDYMGVGR